MKPPFSIFALFSKKKIQLYVESIILIISELREAVQGIMANISELAQLIQKNLNSKVTSYPALENAIPLVS
jgi:pyridoxal/pyridoxine/pyridoxamine kinase